MAKQTRSPRLKIDPEVFEQFLANLRLGVPQTVALKGTGWNKSSYYYKRANDKKFNAKIEMALLDWAQTLNTSNYKLVKMMHPETVKHNIQRMDKLIAGHDYKQALIDAQKKAISELDFERAERLQEQIEKA